MIGIEFCFPSGRYHATPWGRHVNEGEVEWPPSPWRVMRALISVWHTKADQTIFSEAQLSLLMESLSSVLPVYHLPPVTQSHSRHFMPIGKPGDTTLVFDAFVRIRTTDTLFMMWPELELDEVQTMLLQHLLSRLGFLGRAESWVEAKMMGSGDVQPNCYPMLDYQVDELSFPDTLMEPVAVLSPMGVSEFQMWHDEAVKRSGTGQSRGARGRVVKLDLPDNLYEALQIDTGALEHVGWNLAPGSRSITYLRRYDCFAAQPPRKEALTRSYNVARFALAGNPLPRWVDAIRFGEILHLSLMSHSDNQVLPTVSGRDEDAQALRAGHRHGFCLPEDADGDGHIDHLLFIARDPFPNAVLRAIQALTHKGKLWIPKDWREADQEWNVYLEMLANRDEPGTLSIRGDCVSSLLAKSRVWTSSTPYLHPWFTKRNGTFEADQQIRKEIRLRGLPDPVSVERQPFLFSRNGARLRAVQFRRSRIVKSGVRVPADTIGGFWTLRFAEPVSGPIALGVDCHYGLGLFVALSEEDKDGTGLEMVNKKRW